MASGIVNDDLMVRVGKDGHVAALARGAQEMDFTGRPMRGMVIVTEGRSSTSRHSTTGSRSPWSSRSQNPQGEQEHLILGCWRLAACAIGGDTGGMDNRSPQVEAWFETYHNPQKELVRAVRSIILDVDTLMSEAINWKAPTFMYGGNLASFYPRSTKHVALMFHTGASLPDPTGLLEGEGGTSRVARFSDADDLATKTDALRDLVRARIRSKD